jgi:hypothetical protein
LEDFEFGAEMKFRTAILIAFLFLASRPAFSQGCAMCYNTAAASTREGQKAVSKGVMVLLVPPLGFMTLGVWMAFRYGRKRDLEQAEPFSLTFLNDRREGSPRSQATLSVHLN